MSTPYRCSRLRGVIRKNCDTIADQHCDVNLPGQFEEDVHGLATPPMIVANPEII
jgi:hypothetical protein